MFKENEEEERNHVKAVEMKKQFWYERYISKMRLSFLRARQYKQKARS